ncbi:MAG: hypothetical protein SPL73_07470, partial [Cyanobacteriota bacterium]|nr:hypothetical protein [Cyanobacteriota bacterium]
VRIAETRDIIADLPADSLLKRILSRDNMNNAFLKVIGTVKAMRKEPPQKGFFFLRRPLFLKWYKNLYNRSAAFARINA